MDMLLANPRTKMNFHLESNTIIYMGVLPMSASNSSCCWHILQQLYIYTLKITDIYIYIYVHTYTPPQKDRKVNPHSFNGE